MVYVRKKRKKLAFRVVVIFFAVFFLFGSALRAVNTRLDDFIITLVRTELTGEITKMINEAVREALLTEGYGELARMSYDSSGRVRSVIVESAAVTLLRADVSLLMAEKLSALEKFYVSTDISNVIDDEVFFCRLPVRFTVDVLPVGAVETDVKSEFLSAGTNQTSYRLCLTVAASITADVVSAFTVDVCTSVNLVDMLIIGDVPTVVWG